MPSTIDLQTTDLEGARTFYSELFGWEPQIMPEPEAEGYTLFMLDGKQVAGAGPIQMPGTPPSWTMYVSTDDADAVSARVEGAGGTVLAPVTDIFDYGRMAVFMDPSGCVFAVWQEGKHGAGEIRDVPNSYVWSELTTREPATGKEFYGHVFGWTAADREGYTTFKLNGHPAAGMMPMEGDMWPADVPNHWMNYLEVADTDATAARVKELGGSVSVEPADIPPGRFAVVTDPQGASFSIIKTRPDFQPA